MLKNIKTKLLFYTIPFAIIALFLCYYVSVTTARGVITKQINLKIEANQWGQIQHIEDSVLMVQKTTDDLAIGIKNTYQTSTLEEYEKIVKETIALKPYTSGIGIWFAPYVFDENVKNASIYVSQLNGEMITTKEYNEETYDYHNQNYITMGQEAGKSVFTSPYYDEIADTYFITSNSPIYDDAGNYIGCVTADFDIKTVNSIVNFYSQEEMELFILNTEGVFIGNQDESLVQNQVSIFDSADEEMKKIAELVLANDTGTELYAKDGGNYIIYYETIDSLGWKVVYSTSDSVITQPIRTITIYTFCIILVALALLIAVVIFASNKVVHRPIKDILNELEAISNNTYNVEVPERLLSTKDEFSSIGKSIGEMKYNLKEYQTKLENQFLIIERREKDLKVVLEYNNAIVNALPQLIFILDINGDIIDVQGTKIFATRPKEFYLGKSIKEIIAEEYWKSFFDELHKVYHPGDVRKTYFVLDVEGVEEHFDVSLAYCREGEIMLIANRTTELRNQLSRINYLSYHDQVTGLCNRRHYEELLAQSIENKEYPLSIIVSDVNGLKLINDSFGHDEGDKLLILFADVLKEIDVDNQLISRTGGDEFALILPKTDKKIAEKIVAEIEKRCSDKSIHGVQLSVALGVGTLLSEKESVSVILKLAEDEMYQHKLYESSSRRDNTIEIINSTLQAKNPREQLHSNRVSEYCEKIAKALGLPKAEQNKLKTAGLLHDIGKIGISEDVLNKPGRLSKEEYEEICKHPEIGYRILKASESMREIAESVFSHHERLDGLGYPRGIKAEEISLEARIIAIADSYDAMTSERSYRAGMHKDDAVAELIRCKGTQFEPSLVDLFITEVLDKEIE